MADKHMLRTLLFNKLGVAARCITSPASRHAQWAIDELRKKHPDTVKVLKLIKNGANPHERDEDDVSILTHSIWAGAPLVVAALIEKGADPNEKNCADTSALVWAISKSQREIVQYLLDNGANVNEQAGFLNRTPIMHAVFGQAVEVARILLDAGADISIKNADGYTVIDMIQSVPSCRQEVKDLITAHAEKLASQKTAADAAEAALKAAEQAAVLEKELSASRNLPHAISAPAPFKFKHRMGGLP